MVMGSDLEMKSFGPFEIKSEDKGEVVAIVATLGVVDKDGDVIQKGAFPPGGANVKLSGYNHDVIVGGAAPVGKGVVTEEGDHAIFRGKFFMSTERGREAFHTTKELGTEGEWSFGFPKAVKTGELSQEWKAKGAKRMIAGLTPIEASPVFVGAGWGTGTLLTKSAEPDANTEYDDLDPEAVAEPVAQADGDPAEPTAIDRAIESIDKAQAIAGEILAILDAPAVEPVVVSRATAKMLDGLSDKWVTVNPYIVDPTEPEEPVETEEAKAAREADTAYKAARAEAIEEYDRVQRALKRMGYAA
jgi:hypothetical protein